MSHVEESSRKALFEQVALMVRFEDEVEVLSLIPDWVEQELGDDDEELIEELETYAERLLQEERVREAAWSEPTMNDGIDRAFEGLNARGIVALQNVGYTMSDGWSEASEVAANQSSRPRGAVFYHEQDLESGVAGEGLTLVFGAFEDDAAAHEAASLAIGREICDSLTRYGVPVEWNGTVNQRISIPPFTWRKRRWTKAPQA
ncbi:DUF6891 domain-containing protein [Streptomyces chartreusis]